MDLLPLHSPPHSHFSCYTLHIVYFSYIKGGLLPAASNIEKMDYELGSWCQAEFMIELKKW